MASADVAGPRRRPSGPTAAAVIPLVRLDARRPAAWISLGAAVLVGRLLAALGTELGPAVAIACGGLLAVAALDAPGGGLPDGRRRPWLSAWLLQVAWPIVGACGAVAIAGGDPAAAVLLAAGSVATTAATAAAMAAGATAPAAVAVSLALAGAAAGVALIIGVIGSAAWSVQAAGAATAWAVLAAAAWAAPRDEAAAWSWSAAAHDGHRTAGNRGPLTPGMPTRMVPTILAPMPLVVAALASSLAAMVLCFFLAPAFDKFYAAVAGGWFLCLAVPPATTGVGGIIGRRLAAAAPGRPAVPGSIQRAIAASIWILAVLGWPAVVALVLPAADGSRGPGPLLALVFLLGLELSLLAAVGLEAVRPARRLGDLAQSLVFAAAAVAAAGLPLLPPLPWRPDVPRSRSVLSPGGDPAKLPIRRSRLGFTNADPQPRWMSRIDSLAPDNTSSPSRRS